ncbi:MAG: aminotransferase class V-fold PLP-dependent enzyme [Flavobacteriaceae bacterium]
MPLPTPIPCQRALFSIPRDVAYFNAAYMGPLTRAAVEAGRRAAEFKATPWTVSSQDFFTRSDRFRALAARLINASPADIAIVSSASYGAETAARNVDCPKGSRIVLLEDQFPSNVYPWQRKAAATGAEVFAVPRAAARRQGAGQDGACDWTPAILDAIGDATSVVAIPNLHWTDGSLIDLAAVGEKARRHGAALVLDLSQSLGALPFDVAEVRPDFMVSACYKWLLGPYSLGILYAAPHRQGGEPLEENWITRAGSEDFSGLVSYRADYQPGATRYDMGERANFHLMPIAEAALEQLLEWGVPAISETLGETTRLIADAVAPLDFAAPPPATRAPHFLGVAMPEDMPEDISVDLPGRLRGDNVHVSVRGRSIRLTPHLYNDEEDIARLAESLKRLRG